MKEVEGEEAREENEERVIAVEEVIGLIVLDEGARGMSGGRMMGCSRWKGSASHGL